MKPARFVLLLICVLAFGFSLSAQTDNDDEVIRVETQLVYVPVVVTDKTGKPILNLKQSNFVIFEDGKKQEITEFAATAAPFEVALLLDTSGSTRSDLALIQRAAANFVASLRPGDKVSVISYKTERRDDIAFSAVEILSDLTDDRTKLKTAIEQVKTSNSTPFYDSLSTVAKNVFAEKPTEDFRGRRALVALTDGVDSASASDFDEVRAELEKSGIISYFIQISTREFFENNLLGDCRIATRFSAAQIGRFYRVYYPKSKVEKTLDFCQLGDFQRLEISKGLYELADKEMSELATRSGGKVFPAADLSEARNAFRSVAGEIGTKYALAYYPSNDKRDGSYRKIRIELKGIDSGADVRAREGYTSPKK